MTSRTEIASREQFVATLDEGLAVARARQVEVPDWEALLVVIRQFEAMREWVADGRTPTHDERGRINVGLLAVREIPEDEPLGWYCHALNNYFQHWPDEG